MKTISNSHDLTQREHQYLGLAPFLRMSIAGSNLLPIGQAMLSHADAYPDDANLWMNLATVMLCLGQRDLGLAIQSQALDITRVYHLAASIQPATVRLLMIVAPGDLAENTPLDCLLENSDIDLDLYYVSAEFPFSSPMPEHDVLMVAVVESDENRKLLTSLEQLLRSWPQPVINAPQHIYKTGRDTASLFLRDIPGLLMPITLRSSRSVLQSIAAGGVRLAEVFNDSDFPIIVRPLGSQAGQGLAKIEKLDDIDRYLTKITANEFFIAPFIDYSSPDGLFRKFRIALINGAAFACHLAVSVNWMIHYVNADMYHDAPKRAAEASFMAHFDSFADRHCAALNAIYERVQLDYFCIDCAETTDGRLLIFEIDHAMVVHAMDPEEMFPYKKFHIAKVRDALRNYLLHLNQKK